MEIATLSKYTTEVRFICETLAGEEESVGASNMNDIIEKARKKIFDFDYELFDDAYKPVLETKILRYYYTREICAETYGLWKSWLQTRMLTILPYYNKLYEAETLKYSPLFDVDYTTEHKGKSESEQIDEGKDTRTLSGSDTAKHTGSDTRKFDGEQNQTTENKTNSNSWDYYSDTPQGGINGLENNKYLTNARHDTDSTTSEGKGKNLQDDTEKTTYNSQNEMEYGKVDNFNTTASRNLTGTAEYTEHVFGKRNSQTYASMMIEYRKSLINVDEMFIKELKDLFFLLW